MHMVSFSRERKGYGGLLFMALLFLALAAWQAKNTWGILTTYSQTHGTLTLSCDDTDDSDGCNVNVEVNYQVNGETYTIGAWPFVLSSPEQVDVLYNQQDPGTAVVSSFTNLWLGSFVCLVACLFYLSLIIARVQINRFAARKEREWASVALPTW
jgi:hypothetical protein